MLLMGRILQEIMTTRDTFISLLQKLGFVVNLKKSILQPVTQLEFLDLQINIEEMALVFSEEKLAHIIQQCQEVYSQTRTSVLSLTKLIGLLSSTVQAILPGKISISFSSAGANIKSEKVGELPGVCYSWELSQTQTSLVDRKHKAIKWQNNSTAGISVDHPNR